MNTTRQAAKKLGISAKSLSHYVATKKVFSPKILDVGGMIVHSWSDEDVERLRKLLPKIANGRKTRYKKKQSAVSNQHSAKRKTQPGAAALQRTRKPKKTKK